MDQYIEEQLDSKKQDSKSSEKAGKKEKEVAGDAGLSPSLAMKETRL